MIDLFININHWTRWAPTSSVPYMFYFTNPLPFLRVLGDLHFFFEKWIWMNIALRNTFDYFPVPIKLISDMETSGGGPPVQMDAPRRPHSVIRRSWPQAAADTPFSFSNSRLELFVMDLTGGLDPD